jgi:hypothetical protein
LIFGSFYQEKEQEKNNPNEPIPLNPTALIAASFYKEKNKETQKKQVPIFLIPFAPHPALYRLASLFRGTALIFGSFYQEKEQQKNQP